ncbi:polysaccharide pyruvyl transferase family protein [Sanguibacter massiliensis]|uniref:polysaccharide pyruvyl transferase family protein n=1 Tax=Sanguibacter massiliensis TaxID=1973217 RepID=UPI0013ED062C|nr:polysaccharide pyruvyl transferase family protein [Sanguibacter massiliensis]
MTRILLRSAQDPARVLEPYASTFAVGGNTGNLLYAHAVHRTLSTRSTTVRAGAFKAHLLDDPAAWAAKVSSRYDHLVLPMSNAFRIGFSAYLENLAAIIEQLDIPVTVVGIGAQTTADAADDPAHIRMGRTGSEKVAAAAEAARHDAVVRRFVNAVLARSESIGVRGELTRTYLVSLGVDPARVDVIGCPSLFMWGRDHRVREVAGPIGRRSHVGLGADFRVDGATAFAERALREHPRLRVPVQDSRSARWIVAGKEPPGGARPEIVDELFRTRRLVYFPSPWGWIDWVGRQDLLVGYRLHGTIAGLLGGTPSHLLVHDSRTRELAELHGIPHTRIEDLTSVPSVAELAERTDMTRFHELFPDRFDAYVAFLHRNGLRTVYDDGEDASDFDASIARARTTSFVRPARTRAGVQARRARRVLARRFGHR